MYGNRNHERRITAVEERAKSNTHRIDKLESVVEEIHTMSQKWFNSLRKLNIQMKMYVP